MIRRDDHRSGREVAVTAAIAIAGGLLLVALGWWQWQGGFGREGRGQANIFGGVLLALLVPGALWLRWRRSRRR